MFIIMCIFRLQADISKDPLGNSSFGKKGIVKMLLGINHLGIAFVKQG